jgi:hypothetical protein
VDTNVVAAHVSMKVETSWTWFALVANVFPSRMSTAFAIPALRQRTKRMITMMIGSLIKTMATMKMMTGTRMTNKIVPYVTGETK